MLVLLFILTLSSQQEGSLVQNNLHFMLSLSAFATFTALYTPAKLQLVMSSRKSGRLPIHFAQIVVETLFKTTGCSIHIYPLISQTITNPTFSGLSFLP